MILPLLQIVLCMMLLLIGIYIGVAIAERKYDVPPEDRFSL